MDSDLDKRTIRQALDMGRYQGFAACKHRMAMLLLSKIELGFDAAMIEGLVHEVQQLEIEKVEGK